MSRPIVSITLQQFCQADAEPRRLLLKAGFDVRQNALGRRLHREELLAVLREADAVVAGVEAYDAELFDALPRLRCISRCGVGTDAVDLEEARRRGIAVYTTPDEVTEPVAQLTVAMIFALARDLPQHLDAARAGRWEKRTGALLSEWTIGLIGFGRIGRAVARCLRPFGPRIVVHDPALSSSEIPRGFESLDLASLLAASDLISLHASRSRDAGPLLGRQELAAMKPGARLVNTARGHLVDEGALYDALRSGHLAGAALDVFQAEPYAGPLAQLPQVVCTPHVASLTQASRVAMERRCAQHVVDWWSQRCSTLRAPEEAAA